MGHSFKHRHNVFVTSEVPCVKYVMPVVLVSSPLRIGPLLPMDPEEQGRYNGDISIRMMMLRSVGQDPGLDALLQWLGELWWWW